MTRLILLFALVSFQAFSAEPLDAFEANRRLGRGVNLGNGLDAPSEGEWGYTIEPDHFELIKKAGFNSVRIPIRWSVRADTQPPYTISPEFLKRVDEVVDQALGQGLTAVINVHHYDEIFRDPDAHEARLIALWKQIAERYQQRPDSLYFELLNEPHDKLTNDRWGKMFPLLLAEIRKTNPNRIVIIGPGKWNNINEVPWLRLPPEDRQLIATFHYYNPFQFTHQNASWVQGSKEWKGTTWNGTPQEVGAVRGEFEKVAAWSKKNQRPLYLGEFGAYSAADMASRERWTRTIAREAEKLGFGWAYWEFGSSFGIYDPKTKSWRRPLVDALLDRVEKVSPTP